MTPAAHLARAETILTRWQADTTRDAALLAIAHAAVALVRWETGNADIEEQP